MTYRDTPYLLAWSALFESHALAVRAIGKAIQETAPLTLDEYDLLLTLQRSPDGRARLASLANAALFSKSGITRIVQRMIKRGYLRRERCKSDGRGAFASLTAEGRRALEITWKEYSDAILKLFLPLFSPDEVTGLRALLEKVIGELREVPLVSISSRKKPLH